MADKVVSIHAGHRERIRERLRNAGLEAFSDHEVLELLLTYAIARQDVNPLAHELINAFGSLNAVLDADESELLRVKGMGKNAALLLTMMPKLLSRYQISSLGERPTITTLADAKAYCAPLFMGRSEEHIYMICLDQAGHVIHRTLLHTGTVDQVAIHPRTVVETALRHRAHAVILAHNHPSGTSEPSQADIDVTNRIGSALYMISIRLVDHLIFAGQSAFSMVRDCMIEKKPDLCYVRNMAADSAKALREEQYEWIAIIGDTAQ
ncbi:MAG: DNA repair protein RadC [Clostridia bacterium]|nr:DNA repair protein RadC [Clostridia bacterium]